MRASPLVWVLVLLCSGCTNDFGAFSFRGVDGSMPTEGGVSSPDGAAEDAAVDAEAESSVSSGEAGVDSGRADSGAERDGGAGENGGGSGGDAAMDSGNAEDGAAAEAGGSVDTGQQDAESVEEAACRSAFEPVVPDGRYTCDDCGCSGCGDEITSCLQSGDAAEDGLCREVVRCALENSCQVWDCYCSASNCGGGSLDGDGPCVAEMNAAVGGQKAEVMQVWDSGDETEPLVRALDAVSCLVGRDRRSPGGFRRGACESECL